MNRKLYVGNLAYETTEEKTEAMIDKVLAESR